MNSFFETPEVITVLLILLWITGFAAGFGKILFWTALVGQCQYRADRFLEFLNTRKGLFFLLHPVGIADVLVALFLVLLLQSTENGSRVWIEFTILSIVIYTWHAIWYFSSQTTAYLPRWEFKTALLIFGSIILSIITLSLPHVVLDLPIVVSIALFQVLIPLYGWLILGLFSPVIKAVHRSRAHIAQKQITEYAPAVIAIAGSSGKSTTKAYLEHILKGSFSVLSTDGTGPSDEDIIETVIHRLTPEHQVLITELQAYAIGDISQACAIASPIMTIITDIDTSYDSHFLPESLTEALQESITALPSNGLAILNRDDPQSLSLANKVSARTKFFSAQDIGHVYATDIVIRRDSVSYMLHIGDAKRPVTVPLFGKHVVYSILAAAAAATHLGLSIDTIADRIQSERVESGAFTVFYGLHHAIICDNTAAKYAAELRAASDYISIYSDKEKILLSAEGLFHYASSETAPEKILAAKNTQAIITFLRQHLSPDHVVLLQGPIAPKIQRVLLER